MTQPSGDDDRMMTVPQVAEFFAVKAYTIRDWITKGEITPAGKINGSWRIWRSEVVRYANKKFGES